MLQCVLFACFVAFATGLSCYCDICTTVNRTCETNGVCVASIDIEEKDAEPTYSYRCYDKDKLIPEDNPFLCLDTSLNRHKNVVRCCKDRDLCNIDLELTLDQWPEEPEPSWWNKTLVLAVACVVGIIFLMLVALIANLCVRHCRQRSKGAHFLNDIDIYQHNEKLLVPLPEATTSTSGSGLPLLQQRTIAHQLRTVQKVGQGRYGEVYKAQYQTDYVAVKVFLSSDEMSFKRETEIYQTCMLRHENVLGFIASDNLDSNNMMQMWLITDYHERGSLFDFLNRESVDRQLMLRLCLSAVTGLAHLHQDIVGNNSKVAIAHRDIKSKNILVKNNLQCCIADLGLAVKHDLDKDALDVPQAGERTGTVRYMAPEVLDLTLDTRLFDSFKRADVYSMGLVLWEVAKRCSLDGVAEAYQMPFDGIVSNNPKVDEMRQVVSVEKRRPPMSYKWSNDEMMKTMSRLMRECWAPLPAARLTILRVKKTLLQLAEAAEVKL